MANFRVEVIIPRELVNTEQLTRALLNTNKGVAKDIKVDFDVTTQTWNDRPDFEIESKKLTTTITTDSDIYRFINDGTRVRYATMTPDWKSKTVPRIIRSRAGKGGVMYIRKDRPRPGIKAREFDKTIAKKWARLYPRVMQRAINSELR